MARTRVVTLALVMVGLIAVPSASLLAQSTKSSAAGRAKVGDKMMVVVHVIKADKKQQFEDYLAKFDAALEKLAATDPIVRRMIDQTRVLRSAEVNGDGTHNFMWLMDPLVEGGTYDMPLLLSRTMPKAEADKLFQQFVESIDESRANVLTVVQAQR